MTDNAIFVLVGSLALFVLGALVVNWLVQQYRKIVATFIVWEHEAALLMRHGQFVRILEPGVHRFFGHGHQVFRYDTRWQGLVVQGQEILTADKVSVRATALASYRVADALQLRRSTRQGEDVLHGIVQMALRHVICGLEIDPLIEGKSELSHLMLEYVKAEAEPLGLEVRSVALRDLVLAGELKRAYAAVVQSRKQALAELEKARGEAAKLRTLANAARLFANHPQLLQIRYLETLEELSGNKANTVVFASPEEWAKTESVT